MLLWTRLLQTYDLVHLVLLSEHCSHHVIDASYRNPYLCSQNVLRLFIAEEAPIALAHHARTGIPNVIIIVTNLGELQYNVIYQEWLADGHAIHQLILLHPNVTLSVTKNKLNAPVAMVLQNTGHPVVMLSSHNNVPLMLMPLWGVTSPVKCCAPACTTRMSAWHTWAQSWALWSWVDQSRYYDLDDTVLLVHWGIRLLDDWNTVVLDYLTNWDNELLWY